MTTKTQTRRPAKRVAKKISTSYVPTPGMAKATTIATRDTKPHTYLTMITPTVAEMWLGHNSHNRTNAAVASLQGVIERGEWQLNGDAVRFSTDGTLLDGQHRLWAISLSGIAVPSLVITGLDGTAQETLDQGAKRNLADALKLRGETSALALAATLTYWWRYDNGLVRQVSKKPTTPQALAVLETHPGLRDAATFVSTKFRTRFRGSAAMVSVAYYELSSIDSDDAAEFFEKLVSGVNLKAHDPILLLRKHFELLSQEAQGARASSLVSHALIIKAWNYWREGRQIDRLNWKAAGMKAEAFPTPHA